MSASLPAISEPPRAVPADVKLALLSHPDITASLAWTIPACVVLLLSALAQPVRGARIALVITGIVCLVFSLRRALPRLWQVLHTIQRMRWGRIALGRIVECNFASKRRLKPFDKFMKEWNGRDENYDANRAIGCFLTFAAMFFVLPIGFAILLFMIVGVARLFNIPIDAQGDFSWNAFRQLLGIAALTLVFLVVWRFVMRIYLLWELENSLNENRDVADRTHSVDLLQRELDAIFFGPPVKPARENPFPDEAFRRELLCRVEYPGATKREIAACRALFCPRLNRSGVEPLLYTAADPGHVDLLEQLPADVMVSSAGWQLQRGTRPGIGFSIAVAVLVIALATLGYEGFLLVRG